MISRRKYLRFVPRNRAAIRTLLLCVNKKRCGVELTLLFELSVLQLTFTFLGLSKGKPVTQLAINVTLFYWHCNENIFIVISKFLPLEFYFATFL